MFPLLCSCSAPGDSGSWEDKVGVGLLHTDSPELQSGASLEAPGIVWRLLVSLVPTQRQSSGAPERNCAVHRLDPTDASSPGMARCFVPCSLRHNLSLLPRTE